MNKRKNSPAPSKGRNAMANNNHGNNQQGNTRQKRTGLGCSLALVIVLVGLGLVAAIGGPRLLAFVDQTGAATVALNDNTSPAALAERRSQELAQLQEYGWVDQSAGVARIPVARAITLLADNGLPVGAPAAAASQPLTGTTADLSNVNYNDNILPIFEQHCAECHGADNPEEGLQLTTYKTALAGSIYGAVIKPGDPDNSYLVEMVTTGQMPKKGPDLTPAEIETIVAWIKAGAPEQGNANAAPAAAAPAVDLANVSFAKDVLPIFQDRCSECHGSDEPEEGLVLTSYKDVMAGSIYGAVVKPGAPDDSYLVEMISTGKMPKKGDDLTKAQIDTIVAWIKAGALNN
jgi:mono/diheme cytochrome c family protein